MSNLQGLRGAPVTATATGTANAFATLSASTLVTYYITDISGSTDQVSGTLTLLAGAAGATAIWQARVSSSGAYEHSFVTPLAGVQGQLIKLQVSGSLATYANLSGYSITGG